MKDFLKKLKSRRFKQDAKKEDKDKKPEQKTQGIAHQLKTSVRKR